MSEERTKDLKEKEHARRIIELALAIKNKIYMIRQLTKDKGEK